MKARSDCARCAFPKRSEFLISFTYEGFDYEMPLCEQHVELFDREMTGWTRLAKEIGPSSGRDHRPPPKSNGLSPGTAIHFPVTHAGVVADDRVTVDPRKAVSDEAMAYALSEHALERMTQRQVSVNEVYAAISRPTIQRGGRSPNTLVLLSGDVKVVVNSEEKRVLTVSREKEKI